MINVYTIVRFNFMKKLNFLYKLIEYKKYFNTDSIPSLYDQ